MSAQKKTVESIEAARSESEMLAQNVYMAKLLLKLRRTVEAVSDDISDEGGRCYFGNTNQADQLKDLAKELASFRFEYAMDGAQRRDLYAEIRALHEKNEGFEAGIENIAGNAPRKEPRNYPTVGFGELHRGVDPYAADDAIAQAFEEGKVRAWWDAAQMIDALIKTMAGA